MTRPSRPTAMSCPHCGAADAAGRFCAECGQALSARCQACQASLAAGAKFCNECGAATSAPERTAARGGAEPDVGERRQLTVLFCDLVGSTALSGRLDPEEWQELLRAYQDAASTVIEKRGGHVAQYLGDGVLVYFGYPQAHEDDAERAVRAGLGIIDVLRDVNTELGADRQLAVRVGIHTGPVVVSRVGGGTRRETLALGETTNLAARLQGMATPDTVVISVATQRLVSGIFIVDELGPQDLKGIAEPVVCYRAVQPSGVRSRLDVAAGHLTRFVGREVELGTLLDRWERATDGDGQVVLVLGEAGVGKSRLAYELRERLAAERHTWLECRATPYTQGTPFFPVVELVAQGVALGPDDSAVEKIAKLERTIELLGLALAETVPIVARLLGLPIPETYPDLDLGPDMERQRTLEILTTWLLAISSVQPLVLLVEDLHWCDASSLALAGRVIEQSPTARLLLVGTARPDFVSPWPARSNTTTLQLTRLSKRQARELVTALGGALPSDTVETLVVRGDGVPLYIEELTKVVTEPGAAANAIPATLADSLMARLDRLSAAKEVAQRAAVLGREFSYALLAAVADMDEAGLRRGLDRLVESEILFARGEPPAAAYTFKHALVQEAAYESLLKRARQQLHGRACDALAHDAGGAAAQPEVLAHHAERAGRIDDAIGHLTHAGELAQQRSAHAEAVRHFEKAIALLGGSPDSAERDAREIPLQLALAASLVPSQGYSHPATRAALERTTSVAERAGADRAWRLGRVGLALVESTIGHHERGRALAEELLAANAGDDAAAMAHVNIAGPEYWQGRFTSALQHCEAALSACEGGRHRDRVGPLLSNDVAVSVCGWSQWSLALLGRFDAAFARAELGLGHAERSKSPFDEAFALGFASYTMYIIGDCDRARERAARAIAVSDRFGFPFWSGVARVMHGFVRVMAADASGLVEMLDGLKVAGETGNQNGAVFMLSLLADAQRHLQRWDEAQTTLEAALSVVVATGERQWEAELHVIDASLARTTAAPLEEVTARLRKALATARNHGALRSELTAAMAMARVLRDAGRPTDARAELGSVYAKFTEGFGRPLLVDAKALLDELR